jgi:hypothetical protein
VFSVRYELNWYILHGRHSVFKGLMRILCVNTHQFLVDYFAKSSLSSQNNSNIRIIAIR